MKQKRKKGFLGALIGSGVSLIGGIASSFISKNAQEKAAKRQQIAQNRADTYEMANNLSNAYANQDYVDDFQKKVIFRNGGIKQYNDRVKHNKRFACGGRKKAAWGANDTSALITAAGNTFSNLASTAISSSAKTDVTKQAPMIANAPKTEIKTTDYQELNHPNSNDNYVLANILNNPRMFKCGGKRKTK